LTLSASELNEISAKLQHALYLVNRELSSPEAYDGHSKKQSKLTPYEEQQIRKKAGEYPVEEIIREPSEEIKRWKANYNNLMKQRMQEGSTFGLTVSGLDSLKEEDLKNRRRYTECPHCNGKLTD
jgi:hypothetical protein